jgi:hypothetical protein
VSDARVSSSAERIRAPASGNPAWSSIMAPAQIAPDGFAAPWPAIGSDRAEGRTVLKIGCGGGGPARHSSHDPRAARGEGYSARHRPLLTPFLLLRSTAAATRSQTPRRIRSKVQGAARFISVEQVRLFQTFGVATVPRMESSKALASTRRSTSLAEPSRPSSNADDRPSFVILPPGVM